MVFNNLAYTHDLGVPCQTISTQQSMQYFCATSASCQNISRVVTQAKLWTPDPWTPGLVNLGPLTPELLTPAPQDS